MKPVIAMSAALALAGCTVGPDFVRPTIAVPPAYAGAAGLPRGDSDDHAADPDAGFATWWTRLNDPLLNDLIARALAGNPDLLIAQSRVRQARQNERIAGAAALPSITAVGNVAHLQTGGAAVGSVNLPTSTTVYAAGFDASWEIDLFGATRRAVEAARDHTAAAGWDRRDGQVTLVAEVANDYLALRVLQARMVVLHSELARQQDLYALIRARRDSGFVTLTDVNQRTQEVSSAAAQLPALAAEVQVQIHALGVLIGQPPEYLVQTLRPTGAALPPTAVALPIGLPSDLLRRRPDLRAAEARLATANAMIGVREAALYPRLNLLGLGAFSSSALGTLFASQNLVGAGLGMVSLPIFNGGRTRAAIAIAKDDQVQARLAWQAAVLGGFRDVENALARYSAENTRRADLARQVASAASDLAIAQNQAQAGLITQAQVLLAEVTLLADRDKLIQSDAQILIDLIALYKALGGGWTDLPPDPL
jgi:NodT family efflux transporter outer membrane factor (OMF) lipoprotein